MNSSTKERYFRVGHDRRTIPLAEMKRVVTLSTSVYRDGNQAASAHAPFTNMTTRLTLKEWQDILGTSNQAV